MAEMASEIREGLRDLCSGHGWSYGICWKFDQQNPRLLVIGDSYYEEQFATTIAMDQMNSQVHLVGEGTIGVAAMSGKHQWIYSDTPQMELNPSLSCNKNEEMSKWIIAWQDQFLTGIETIVIISLPSFGVVQFGSTQKIDESAKFINQAQQFFHQLETRNRHHVHGNPDKSVDICDTDEVFPSVSTSTFSKNCNSLHDVITNELHDNAEPSTSSVLTSSLFDNPTHLKYEFSCNSLFNNSVASNWAEGITILPLPEQTLSPGLTVNSTSLSAMSSSKSSCFTSELPDDFLSFLKDSDTEHPALFQFDDNQIHSCEQPIQLKDYSSNILSETISSSTLTDLANKPVEISSDAPTELPLDKELFVDMDFDLNPGDLKQDSWDDIIVSAGPRSCSSLSPNVSECISDMNTERSSGSNFELLEAVVEGTSNLSSNIDSFSTNLCTIGCLDLKSQATFTGVGCLSSRTTNVSSIGGLGLLHQDSALVKMKCPKLYTTQNHLPQLSLEKIIQQYSKESLLNSKARSWTRNSHAMNSKSGVTNQPNKPVETAKVSRKRSRPGVGTRPRPKDRQLIQDRVKDLREIVPNASQCSIDSVLGQTIKYMLFLQSITKYADKLKLSDEPKMIGQASGVVLKENSTGAEWFYQVAPQAMVCPRGVNDLEPTGQMLIEMLCEDHGFFLEIADGVRGIGLTILHSLIEIRETKIWARFLVEATGDVLKIDIFLSLVQLFQQMSSIRSTDQQSRVQDKGVPPTLTSYQQPQQRFPISLAGTLG